MAKQISKIEILFKAIQNLWRIKPNCLASRRSCIQTTNVPTLEESEYNNGEKPNETGIVSWQRSYRRNDGLWFYTTFCAYDDALDLMASPQFMSIRRRMRKKKKKWLVIKPNFTFQLDPKIPFTEPDLNNKRDVFNSGDPITLLEPIDLSKPQPFFENSEELKTASEDVKRLFSLSMSKRKEIVEYQMRDLADKVKRHGLDESSEEVHVARLTIRIRSLQEIFRADPKNRRVKDLICCCTDKRNKKLRILRMQDMQRFEWLVHTLGITYRPSKLGMQDTTPTRESELMRITEEYCEKIKKDKLEAYHQKLKAQQEEFLREKMKTLEWIEEQEKKFGLNLDKIQKKT